MTECARSLQIDWLNISLKSFVYMDFRIIFLMTGKGTSTDYSYKYKKELRLLQSSSFIQTCDSYSSTGFKRYCDCAPGYITRSLSCRGTSLSSHSCGRCRSSIKTQILFGLILAAALEKRKQGVCL